MLKKSLSFLLVFVMTVSAFAPSFFVFAPIAKAATTVDVSTSGLINGNFPGAPIKASSAATAIVKISVTSNQAGQTLNAVTVNFGGTGFATTDLEALATGATSGVALYNDAGSSAGSFDGTDAAITLSLPTWSGNNTTLAPATPVSLTQNVASILYIAIKTSGTIANDDRIMVTIPANSVVASDGSGPAANFNANDLKADTSAPTIAEVAGYSGGTSVNVRFSEPVQKVDGGNIAFVSSGDPFTFVDNGTTNTHTVSAVSHNAGQDFATITFSGNTDSGDFDGTPSTLAAGSNKIADMAGNVMGTSAASFSSPLTITTTTISSTYVGAVYNSGVPLVTFVASGGTPTYTFSGATAGDSTTLTTLGLSLDGATGKLTGTVANVTGNYFVGIKATDSAGTPANFTKYFTINVAATSTSSVPSISSVSPAGGAQGATNMAVSISGSGTSFSGSSTVQFLLNGSNDANMTVSSISAASATSLSFNLTITGGAAIGNRDVKVATGSQTVIMPYSFNIFASGASGLTLLSPAEAASNVQIPPNFNFNPSSNGSINSYRITVKSTSDFSGTTLWDYAYPKPADGQNSNGSHCSSTSCNVGYGAGQFRIITQPTPLSPNTMYYWQVRTYSGQTSDVSDSVSPLEFTPVKGFTTASSISDATPPTIMHRPIFQATASANLNVFARVMDNIATKDTNPALTTKLLYCAGSGCTPTTEATSTYVGAGYFKYVIPSGTISIAGTIARYYLQATDGTNTANFKQPDDTPFQLTSATAGSATIAGNVKDGSNNNLSGATVFADGSGFSATTDGSGNYTLSGLFAGTYDLVAVKEGYADRRIDGAYSGATGINFALPSGYSGGFGGDTTKPKIKFNGPMDGMTGIPGGDSNFKIFVAFDKPMSQTSVTATGNMTVNEINISTGGLTNITASKGGWTYYNTAPNIAGVPPEANLAVWSFSGSNTFGDNKTIAVIVSGNVTDTAGNSIQGNQPDGSYAFSFLTGSTATFSGGTLQGGTFGTGAFVPPHVNGAMPSPGSFDVPRNSKIVINFSDPMADDGGGYILKNFIKLFTVSSGVETDVSASAINTVSLDTAKLNATVALPNTYNSGTFAASTNYRVKVLGGAKAANGMTIAPPGSESSTMFMDDFKTGTASDTAAPTVLGSYPDSGANNVSVNVGTVSVGFSKDMDISTITTGTVYLSVGSTVVNGTVEYRGLERMAYFVPKTALNPNTTYTLNVTAGATGLNGTVLNPVISRTFTTGGADATAPAIAFMNGDDYSVAITFSEPMNAAKATDSLNWSTSVINPAVYNVIKYGAAGFNPASAGTAVSLSGANLKYDSVTNTVIIEGLSLSVAIGQELYLSMDISGDPASGAQTVKDLSGNAITSAGNAMRSPIQNSQLTKGALGPMAMSGDMFSMEGGFMPTNFSSTTFGFAPPVEVKPFNMMAGQTTIYGVRLPISQQIPAAGTIVLTFPTGFDVSGAKQDVNSPMKTDFNGPGTGTPTFKCQTATGGTSCGGGATVTGDASGDSATKGGLADDGVLVNTSARTVTIYLSAATNSGGNDFLTVDVAGIKNSTVPKDFSTSGYTVDIKTKNDSTVLESLTSMPFFIQSAGSYTLSGTITATGNDQSGTMKVYIGSPMTGPMEATSSNFSGGATATYSFANLSAGEYFLFTDQSITLGSKEFAGKSMPERIQLSGNTTYNFTLTNNTTGGTNVTISVDGPSSEPLDIFAGSPTGFKVKQVTLDASAGAENFTINLGNGQWFVGVGPQMPKGPMGGIPSTPNYLPPKPVEISVSGATVTESSGTANDGTIAFTLTSATKTIKGVVKDGSDKVIANAEIYAYSPSGGFGTHAQSDTSGSFTLNVIDGSYIVGSFVPGMPPSKEVPVTVTSHATTYLLINGSTTAITPAAAATSFILKVAKPDYTISGKVTDGTNVVQGASVYAYRTDGPGHANAITDSSGSYTLYVSNGSWKVGVFLPQYGNLTELTVTINGSSASNQNFSPTQTGTFYTVSGRAYKDITSGGGFNGSDEAIQGAFVRLIGNNTFNEAITGSDGQYSFKVSSGNGYVLKAFAPGIGELPPLASFNVSADTANKDFAITAPRTITFTLSTSITKAFIDAFTSTGQGNHIEINGGTTGTMSLSDGSYSVRVSIPGMVIGLTDVAGTDGNTAYSNTTGVMTVDGSEGITITLPTLRTVSGTVTDGANNISEAWVEIGNPTTGVHFGTKSASNGSFSLKVADSSSAYFISAMKPGYFREPSSLTINGADPSVQTLILTTASTTIAGQALIGSSGAANAFVRAEKQGGGFSGTQADANGVYTLYVSSGVWKVYAVAEGYAEAGYSANPIDVTGGSVTGKNITVTSSVSLNPPKSKPITPASGGTLEDTTAGVKLTIPANALGSSTSSGNIQAKETNNVRETDSARPVGGKAKDIKATDSSGNPITILNNSVTVEMTYTKAELAAVASEADSSINTKAEVDKLKMAYWDETTANWVTLASSLTYKDSDGAVMSGPASDLSNISTVVVSAATDHFSLYAPVVSTDPSAPSTPTGLAASAAGTTQINLSWTAVSGATSYDIYRSTSSGGTYSRVGSEPTVSSGSTTSYSDTGLSSATAYYYKITALNASGESAASSAVTATTQSSGGGGSYSDTTPPSNTSIVIAAGAEKASSVNVTLTLSAWDVSQMMMSNNADFSGANWEDYATSKSWTLSSGSGVKTVYAKFKDSVGNVSTAVSDTIALEGSGLTTSQEASITETLQATTSEFKDGDLIRAEGDTKVYVIKDGKKVWIASAEIFNAAGYDWKKITVITPSKVAGTIETTLIRAEGDNRVYVVNNGVKSWIKTAEEFANKEYKWADVVVLSKVSVDAYPETMVAAETTQATDAYAFKKFLTIGSFGDEVKQLQIKLKAMGYFPADINPTGYFGKITRDAVKKFQQAKGISPLGYVGPQTRKSLNE